MLTIAAGDLDRHLDPKTLRRHLGNAFKDDIVVPPRHHHGIDADGRAVHLLMPAWTGGAPGEGHYLGTKIVNVFADNGRLGLPAVSGTYLLQSGETGLPVAFVDGTRLTLHRTAAVAALGSELLSRPESHRMLMVGAGALAPFLIRAHAAARPITRVEIWNRSPESAARLAEQLVGSGLEVAVTDDLAAATARADLVCCATLAQAPLIRGDWLRPGQHLDLVGAFTMAMREADDAALQRARLFVDTASARSEGGDIAVALAAGTIAPAAVLATLPDLCRGLHAGRRSSGEITLFKAVGTAAADLATAMLAFERASRDA